MKTWTWQLVDFHGTPRIIADRSLRGRGGEMFSFLKLKPSQYANPFTLYEDFNFTRVWTPRRSTLLAVAAWEADRMPVMTTSGVTWRGTARCVLAWLRAEVRRRKGNPLCGDTWRIFEREIATFQRYLALLKASQGPCP